MKYPLATDSWGEEERNAAIANIRSGHLTMGEEVAAFERELASYVGSRYAVMVNSGSSANLIAVAALFFTKEPILKAGDSVVVPAVSWATTYYPLSQYGLRLKFVDVDPGTFNIDPEQLNVAIDSQTRLLCVVNLLGNPCQFDAIRSIATQHNLTILEDNCEALGAEFEGRLTGTFGLVGTFSTYFSHHISTIEGGLVVTDDEEIYHILLSLRSHGWTRNLPPGNSITGMTNDPFFESFRFIMPGYNVRPSELAGTTGRCQLRKLPSFLEVRRENAERFIDEFNQSPIFDIQAEVGRSSWFGFGLLLKPECGVNRRDVIEVLGSAGVDTRPIVAGNFVRNEVMRFLDHSVCGDLRGADRIHTDGFFVGNSHINLGREIERMHEILHERFGA